MKEAMKACGTLALDAFTIGALSRAAEREQLELEVQVAFPDDWQTVLGLMDRFGRASSHRDLGEQVMYMWARGVILKEDAIHLLQVCPAAFRDADLGDVIGQPSVEVLPRLARALPA